MFRFLFLIIILISFTTFIAGQDKIQKTSKIDEFGAINEDDMGARIDNFFIQLQNNPEAKGKIIIYKGLDVLPGKYENQNWWVSRAIQNHIFFRGFDKSRIEIVETGYRDKRITELWLVPKNADSPKPNKLKPKPKLPKSKTFLYDNKYLVPLYFESEPHHLLLASVIAENDAVEDSYSKGLESDMKKFYEENKFFWLSDSYGKTLKANPKLYGEIIFYADDTRLDTAKIREMIQEGKDKIISETKILPDRIKITFGGYRGFIQADFWIVSYNDKQPVPTPEEQPEAEDN